ncbi:arylamine N-acetyltransferase family protein [Pseudonocardia phyllosphaerae]|uniref:arylamine N-acetyltransferase family protein n=1 Tax=Pseudonocardia phyllosphaerae TaxID=3390502 RepID=UPI00397B73C6
MTTALGSTTTAYLDRIGVDPGPPDAGLLARIVRAHLAVIPFENLDPFTGTEPPVTADDVAAKLVHGRRGGWCFEQNLLLHDVLADLGYRVEPLIGRVRLGAAPEDPPTRRSHRLTLIDLDGQWVTADVGFGGMNAVLPLRLETGTVQPTPFGGYRYTVDDPGGPATPVWSLRRTGSGGEQVLYTFDLTPAPAVDYETASWYLTHHPESLFRTGLTAAVTGPDRRTTLDGPRLTVHPAGGEAHARELASPVAVRDALEDVFGIDTGTVPGLTGRIAEVYFS